MHWLARFILALLTALAFFCGVVAWEIVQFGNQPYNESAEAAVVLGAAAWGSKPSPVYRERINEALLLYQAGRVKWIIFTGGTREPGFLSEAEVGRQFSVQHGVPIEATLIDTESHTTWQNLEHAKDLMRTANLHSALLVSDPLHMRRAMAMAKDLGLNVQAAPTLSSRFRSWLPWSKFLWRETWLNIDYMILGRPS
jgi:uncharacterized SAM-binding protein YcdF (DUF218 family)